MKDLTYMYIVDSGIGSHLAHRPFTTLMVTIPICNLAPIVFIMVEIMVEIYSDGAFCDLYNILTSRILIYSFRQILSREVNTLIKHRGLTRLKMCA